MNVNVVAIGGNLTRDPETRDAGSTTVTNLGVAVNDRVKVNDEWEDRANFFDVTVWGAQGENCAKYLSKGSLVFIQGRLRWESWEDKDTGAKRNKVSITASSVQFGSKAESNGHAVGGDDSDLPF